MKRNNGTDKKIIQAALELFVRKSYRGSSITDITRKVGVTKGALYSHFRSKGELLLRIIDEFKTKYLDEMVRSVNEREGDAIEKLNRSVSFSSKFAYEHLNLCVFLTFLTTELKADVDFEPALKSVYREYQGFISGLIRQGISQGLIDKELNPDLAALTFMALHDGVLHQWVLNRNRIDAEEYVKTFRKIFFYGLVIDKDHPKAQNRT